MLMPVFVPKLWKQIGRNRINANAWRRRSNPKRHSDVTSDDELQEDKMESKKEVRAARVNGVILHKEIAPL